ncbi:X-Pro dipeptidyl-peptidase (S15 family) [Seminavis robusta]|uniref:X-Pro dipeptidyl-peptidase (S15 family) n=1 Tax=Seminavis robusta TaxID=568900 RepID=A0A9N8DN49_9STRA|nr:X-Pro dipeptidyl-peptidase (S15 family) [Seminavis robusta]|eukprot:Sro229_g092870.1 X-Pro dipeptidyl-peptidase (S15 family) (327) ;mRNA; f:6114-7094
MIDKGLKIRFDSNTPSKSNRIESKPELFCRRSISSTVQAGRSMMPQGFRVFASITVAIIAILTAATSPSFLSRLGSAFAKKPPSPKSPLSKSVFRTKMPSEQSIVLPTSNAPGLLSDMESDLAVVLTHPWGPLGGNMHNNVVIAGARHFQRLGITTLRFDFVGWQLSWGTFQAQQVVEAANYLTENTKATKIMLVGYSYGSLLAASASAQVDAVVASVSIAPPWSVKHWLLLFNSNHHLNQAKQKENLPRLCLLGDNDNFTTEQVFWKTLEGFPADSTTGKILPNADHFFRGRESDVMKEIEEWLLKIFPKCQGDPKKLASAEVYE